MLRSCTPSFRIAAGPFDRDDSDPEASCLRSALRSGAVEGASLGFVCGVLEVWLLAILPWFLTARENYRSFDAAYSVAFTAGYTLAGGLAGLIIAGCLFVVFRSFGQRAHFARSGILRLILISTLFLVFESNNSFDGGRWLPLDRVLVSKFLLALWLFGALVSRSQRFLQFLTWPALAIAFYMAPLSVLETLSDEGSSRAVAYTGSAVALCLVVGIGIVCQKVKTWQWTRASLTSARLVFSCCALSGFMISLLFRPAIVTEPGTSATLPGSKPNVILIVLDTVRADRLDTYGYYRETSPNLRRFASESTLFTRAAAAGDWTLPSHASIFTGRYAKNHGVHNQRTFEARSLAAGNTTIAEILSGHGFSTAAVVSNLAVSKALNFNQGFHHFDQSWNPYIVGWHFTFPYSLRGTVARFRSALPSSWLADCRPATAVNAAAFQQMKSFTRERPFFLFLNYMDAHDPYLSSDRFRNAYGQRGSLWSPRRFRRFRTESLTGLAPLPQVEVAGLNARYDAAIASLDFELGKLFDHLRMTGLYDKSVIVVTADHGEALGEKGHMEHGGMSVYENQVHVPLIIRYPGGRKGMVVRAPASHVDIVPTILATLGYKAPPGIDGVNLNTDIPAESRLVFSEMYPHSLSLHPGAKRFRYGKQAAYAREWKLIASGDGSRELFNLSSDPREDHNLIQQGLPAAARLEAQLVEWRRSSSDRGNHSPGLAPEAMERLKSLGYVQGK